MPTQHLVTVLDATPPERATQVLLAMPADRVERLIAAMDGRLIARMLIATDPQRRAALLAHLDDTRLAAELALLPLAEAAAVVAALPPDRVTPQLGRVSSEHLAMLLDAMPGPQRRRLADALDSRRLADLRRVGYEKAVIESLRRTSAHLSWVPDDRGSNLFASVFHRLFGIALCYVDRGWLPATAVPSARRVFARERVHGVLIISNAAPDRPVPESGSERPALVVTWDPDDNDGVLGRALVRLAG